MRMSGRLGAPGVEVIPSKLESVENKDKGNSMRFEFSKFLFDRIL